MKCLIVDDSRVVRRVSRRIVEDLGFECEEAEDGQQAYDACQDSAPDVILLNWNMPVLSGIEFLKKLRCISHIRQPKVIMCTTEYSVENITQALDAGADEYIMKPFDSDIIQTKLAQVGLIDPI